MNGRKIIIMAGFFLFAAEGINATPGPQNATGLNKHSLKKFESLDKNTPFTTIYKPSSKSH
ncbi:MAG: hypothetical protein PSV35_08720 [bacterium]|nr:hypothetical protein [bacterium]